MLVGTDRKKKLAIFTPHSLAGSNKKKEESPSNRPESSNTINIDAGAVAEKLLEVGLHLFSRRQRKRERREQNLDKGVLRLARRLNGLMGLPDLLGFRICGAVEGQASLDRLSRQGHCSHLCDYNDEAVYVFPEFLQRAWICEYCDSSFPTEEKDSKERCCENCCAPMQLEVI